MRPEAMRAFRIGPPTLGGAVADTAAAFLVATSCDGEVSWNVLLGKTLSGYLESLDFFFFFDHLVFFFLQNPKPHVRVVIKVAVVSFIYIRNLKKKLAGF